jgi:hypothetical protein
MHMAWPCRHLHAAVQQEMLRSACTAGVGVQLGTDRGDVGWGGPLQCSRGLASSDGLMHCRL